MSNVMPKALAPVINTNPFTRRTPFGVFAHVIAFILAFTAAATSVFGAVFVSPTWVAAKTNADLGQDYVVLPTVTGGNSYQIRVRDASDQLLHNGRIYSFLFPTSCGQQCGLPYTPVTYTVQ